MNKKETYTREKVLHNVKERMLEDCNKCKWFIRGECETPNNCCDFEEIYADIKNFAEFLKRRLDGRCNGLMIQGYIDDALEDYLNK